LEKKLSNQNDFNTNVKRLTAVFDLNVVPPTYDVIPFLIAAEIHRLQLGCDSMRFVVVPAESSENTLGISSVENIAWRIRQIIIPATSLMPSCKSLTVFDSRKHAESELQKFKIEVYPENYTVAAPTAGFSVAEIEAMTYYDIEIPTIQASEQALVYIKNWIKEFSKGRKPISVTLREADNAVAKNSNISAWAKFLNSLDQTKFFPFIIRDTDRVFEKKNKLMENFEYFSLGAVNIELRAAIYEVCYLNLIGSSGPTQLCMFDRTVRYLVFNIGVPGWSDTKPEAYRNNYGIELGHQLRISNPYQRIVWGNDRAKTISEYFSLMIRFIEKGDKALHNKKERDFFAGNEESLEVFAERLFIARQWGPSRKIYRQALLSEPRNSQYFYRLGVAETWGKNPMKGLAYLEKAIKLGLSTAELFIAKGEALLELNRLEQAVANFQQALSINPDLMDGILRMGMVCEMQGQIADAQYWIERALKLNPDSAIAHQYLGIIFLRLNEKIKAEEQFAESKRLANLG
jgi:tetratricopeptide (TPR) repeat protein